MIYVIGEHRQGPVKIGWAQRPAERLKSIQTGNPAPLTVLAVFTAPRTAETDLHEVFADRRLVGEWFNFTDSDSVDAVNDALGGDRATKLRAPGRRCRRGTDPDTVILERLTAASIDGLVLASRTDIAAVTGLTMRSVTDSVQRLIAAGLLEVVRQGVSVIPSCFRICDRQGHLDLPELDAATTERLALTPWVEGTPWLIPERRLTAFPLRARLGVDIPP